MGRGKHLPQHPILGPEDKIAEGDSRIMYDAIHTLPEGIRTNIFDLVRSEVNWQKMFHAAGEVPRLVCVQGDVDPRDGSMPVYRHPSDQSPPLVPFTPIVNQIRSAVETLVKHRVNHVLVQLYRSGYDYISEHSDKTLDIVPGSVITNVSLGAQRVMRLRTKRNFTDYKSIDKAVDEMSDRNHSHDQAKRFTQLIPMPHGSAFILGLASNAKWLHGINADKRPLTERSEEELAFAGERISLTFRNIGTFLTSNGSLIWGQGACAKDKVGARSVINGDEPMTRAMIDAFGYENQQSDLDWSSVYGKGFDVLHFRSPPPLS